VHGTLEQKLFWEGQKMNVQICLEDAMRAIANNTQRPTVILCDRSAQDSQACWSSLALKAMVVLVSFHSLTL
jgi:hypothetical protein